MDTSVALAAAQVQHTPHESVLLHLLSPDAAEREELIAAGVAAARVNALYPLEIDRLAVEATARARRYGLRNLSLGGTGSELSWQAHIEQAAAIRNSLPIHQRDQYEQQWAGWWAENAHGDLSARVYAELREVLDASEADYYTGWYLRAMFICYWALAHGQSAPMRIARAEVAQWIVEDLLAQTGGADG